MKKSKYQLFVWFMLMIGLGVSSWPAGAESVRQEFDYEYVFPIFYTPEADVSPYAKLTEAATGLVSPVALTAPNDGSGRIFVVDQVGQIRIIDSSGDLVETPFLDISDQLVELGDTFDERGLLGLAFHPDYATNGRFFVYYSAPLRAGGTGAHTNQVSEFSVSGDPDVADPTSEEVILEVDNPQSNHNAGAITFGPDGYLYISLGDGGGGGDDDAGHAEDWYDVNGGGNGQDVEDNLLGSVLRIDVDSGDPYAVPPDNPEVSDNFPEIWAYGFRNPYRMSFDPGGSNELFLADAGQSLYEEASIVQKGGNYGWNVKEGTHCFSAANPGDPDAITNCPDTDPEDDPLIDPVIEFNNQRHPNGGLGTTIVGGEVYRGSDVPTWVGNYFFGYFTSSHGSADGGLLLGIRPEDGDAGLWEILPIEFTNTPNGRLNAYLMGFGQDQNNNIYLLTTGPEGLSGTDGVVYRLDAP